MFIVLAATCTLLRRKHPSATSGDYIIAPKGSHSTFQVFCDMTAKNGIGVTVIGHNSESETIVKGYEYPGSYKRQVRYNLTMKQILAVINESKSCEQFISYKCFQSTIWNEHGDHIAWWISQQGSTMNYWGGADIDSGKCACGTRGSCGGNKGKCDCDNNDKTWREDSGYLADKSTLPVTELRFGDTGNDGEEGKHTLGKLQCWG